MPLSNAVLRYIFLGWKIFWMRCIQDIGNPYNRHFLTSQRNFITTQIISTINNIPKSQQNNNSENQLNLQLPVWPLSLWASQNKQRYNEKQLIYLSTFPTHQPLVNTTITVIWVSRHLIHLYMSVAWKNVEKSSKSSETK